jgi:hypothetical protein
MVLGLGQEILALPGLNGGPGQVVLHLVPLDGQELEVLVRYPKLVDSLQESGIIFQPKAQYNTVHTVKILRSTNQPNFDH